MFDIGWQELFVIGVVTVVILGPKELPNAIRTVTGLVRKARAMAGEFQRGVDEMVRESELDDLRKQAEEVARLDVGAEVKRHIDPEGELDRDFATRAWEADLDAMQAKQSIGTPPAEAAAANPAPAPAPSLQPAEGQTPSPESAADAAVTDPPAARRDQAIG